jgi:hypothetical protein
VTSLWLDEIAASKPGLRFVKIQTIITVRDTSALDAGAIKCLTDLNPVSSRRSYFRFEFPHEDSRVGEILALLKAQGMRPWPDGTSEASREATANEYRLTYLRQYEQSDYEKAPLLVPAPHARADLDRSLESDGFLHLLSREMSKGWSFAEACWWWVVVRGHVKTAIESAGLNHVAFKPVKVNFKDREIETDRLWELTSSFELPPLSPICTLFHSNMTPFSGDYSKGCRLEERHYVPAEFHYRREDLAKLGDFDLARTHEEFPYSHPNPRKYHKLVASQRFYRFCRQQKYQMNWIPVRIDPD